MNNRPPARVRFGRFELDLRSGELHEGNNKVTLTEQQFQLLRMLIERGSQIITRDEIESELWSQGVVVEFAHSISAAIAKLRKTLGDSAEEPTYIETVASRGYRLMVPVEWIESAGVDSAPPAPPEPSSWIGKKVSHYRILEIIGGGGMGVVYKAEDLTLGRQVALKFLPEELASNPMALDHFRLEARTASSLNHPNICTIYDLDEHEGKLFIVMELLEGQTLRGCLVSGTLRGAGPATQLALEKLLDIAFQILDGLKAAHEKGIIHRDIKPVNVFITNRGVAKILDFGLAKLVGGPEQGAIAQLEALTAAASQGGTTTSHLSWHGNAAGTAAYMSPEQVRGEKLDVRTDLFSFGLVLYEMAAGQRAFSRETVDALYDAILNQTPVPVHEVRPDVPPKLEQIIDKALEKDRKQRYQSAAQLGADLREVRDTRSQDPLSGTSPLTLHPATREFSHGNRKITLQEQAFQLLQMLAERNGGIVTREDVRKELWPADTTVEFDHSMNSVIHQLRRTLGDDPEKPRYIETVTGRGYRLLVPTDRQLAARPEEDAVGFGSATRLQTLEAAD